MKKIVFNLVLLAAGLLVGTNAWATERTAGTIAELKSELSAAQDGDVIKLIADMTFSSTENTEMAPNITKSITLDGQGHTISGWGQRTTSALPTILVNHNGGSKIDVTIQNLIIRNGAANSKARGIETRGNIGSLTVQNCKIYCTKSNEAGIQIGGNQEDAAIVIIENTEIDANTSGYPVKMYNPIDLRMTNCKTNGYCALYFKGQDGSAGSRGTIVHAKDCEFDAVKGSTVEGFAILACEDSGLDITLEDCGVNFDFMGNTQLKLWSMSDYTALDRRGEPITVTIEGNNSYIFGSFIIDGTYGWYDSSYNDYLWNDYVELNDPSTNKHLYIKGGTHSMDPRHVKYIDPYYITAPDTKDLLPAGYGNQEVNCVPEGYEVSEVQQLGSDGNPVTLYRVHPKVAKDEQGVAYKLNDNVEKQGGGQNPNTSFILSADETVAAEKTYAEYVEVNAGTITIPTGKALNVGEAGLVVKDGAQIVVEAGGVLTVSKGGTISAKDESIIIGADATNGAGSYLVDPVVTFNQQPKATVKMTANIGLQGGDYKWHRFAMPVTRLENAWSKSPDLGTYLYGWDYENKDWKNMEGSTNMVPFQGYTVTTKNMAPGEMEFTFEGDLLGNVKSNIDFTSIGYGYFGNSYTGYILAKTMLADFQDIEGVEGQVWMWDAANQSYSGVSLTDLLNDRDLEDFQREIAPMHTFILKTNSGEGATIDIDYIAAIWGNPRYGLVENPASAPARTKDTDDAFVGIKVISANGVVDRIRLTENAENSDMYENSVDATKYMNENSMNLYATVDGEDYTSLYTNNLLGKKLTLQTMNEVNYTLLVNDVIGSEYALQDMLTGEIISLQAGETYSFSAQPNSTSERFQIVRARTMPTGTDKIVATKAAKGIYTMLGQYMGNASEWDKLPAGAYLVNGVKIVK